MNPRGFGFVAGGAGQDDVYVPPEAIGGALHGDQQHVRGGGWGGTWVKRQVWPTISQANTQVRSALAVDLAVSVLKGRRSEVGGQIDFC